jgi:2-keto-4-pentenoate hydratase/2-oxohepta-3-ene-1,7-dioic acid hydratase in catechol pathway
MPHWVRFEHAGQTGFGTLRDGIITPHNGDMFAGASARAETLAASAVRLLTPSVPSKMVCLWNNYHALAAKLNVPVPTEPLYFMKATNSFLASGEVIRVPHSYAGKVVYEGELGIVIGKRCKAVSEAQARDYIFGYTCVNDVTAAEIINKDASFAQWTRAKNFDTFGVFGPAIVTDVEPTALTVTALLNGKERQNYPVSDIVFAPHKLVSLISQDMTLLPGDVIACGTSLGVGSMKPGNKIEVVIDGIGTLTNQYE